MPNALSIEQDTKTGLWYAKTPDVGDGEHRFQFANGILSIVILGVCMQEGAPVVVHSLNKKNAIFIPGTTSANDIFKALFSQTVTLFFSGIAIYPCPKGQPMSKYLRPAGEKLAGQLAPGCLMIEQPGGNWQARITGPGKHYQFLDGTETTNIVTLANAMQEGKDGVVKNIGKIFATDLPGEKVYSDLFDPAVALFYEKTLIWNAKKREEVATDPIAAGKALADAIDSAAAE